MKNRKTTCSTIAMALLMTVGCTASPSANMLDSKSAASESPSNGTPDSRSAEPGAALEANLVTANNQFCFDLFGQLRKPDSDKNLFFSPISITMALAMTYNGAAGETEKEMAHTLKLKGMSLERINQKTVDLLTLLKSADPKVELSIANSIWAREDVQFKEDFLARNRQFFGAKVACLDFTDPLTPTKINGWINTNTKGKIDRIIDRIDPREVMLLINAVYFKGKWGREFDKRNSRDKPFHLLDGKTKHVPMMSQSGIYLYFQGEKFQTVTIPYGKGDVNLYLFLPDQDSSLNDFLNGLSHQKWEQWMKSFKKSLGVVWIPRFKLEYEQKLNDSLQTLGMKSAFDQYQADFSGMRARTERNLYVSEVKHKAMIEVNEEGTVAAAVTALRVFERGGEINQQQPFTFIADRPFLMAICDRQTGTILFMGTVIEP